MNKYTLLLALMLSLTGAARAADLMTVQGRSYQNCRILKVSPDGVTFRHTKGVARILFSDMTTASQKEFGYDPDKERAFEKQQAEERAQKRELARQRAEAAAKAYAAAQQTAMEHRTHQALQLAALVQAMSAQQNAGFGLGGFVSIGGSNGNLLLPGVGPYFANNGYGRDFHRFGYRTNRAPTYFQGYSDSLFGNYGALVNYGARTGGGIITRNAANGGCPSGIAPVSRVSRASAPRAPVVVKSRG
ncbi:MAG: hypothetical protein JNJ83_16500 [Verrucomicrobiaceae bacterium]|nr:hypothetical protein [Verrucomicrobiaceae bacterium]